MLFAKCLIVHVSMARIFHDNLVSIMAADALTPCIANPPAAMELTIYIYISMG